MEIVVALAEYIAVCESASRAVNCRGKPAFPFDCH